MIEKYKDGDTCLACAKGKLTGIRVDLPMEFGVSTGGKKRVFENAKIFQCDTCPEGFFDKETNKRIDEWVKEKLDESNK